MSVELTERCKERILLVFSKMDKPLSSHVPNLSQQSTTFCRRLAATLSDVSVALKESSSALREEGIKSDTKDYRRKITAAANSLISVAEGVETRDAEIEDLSEALAQYKTVRDLLVAAAKEAKPEKKKKDTETPIEGMRLWENVVGEGDKDIVDSHREYLKKTRDYWKKYGDRYSNLKPWAKKMPRKGDKRAVAILRMPVVPLVELASGFADMDRLQGAKSLHVTLLEKGYPILHDQLIIAVNNDPEVHGLGAGQFKPETGLKDFLAGLKVKQAKWLEKQTDLAREEVKKEVKDASKRVTALRAKIDKLRAEAKRRFDEHVKEYKDQQKSERRHHRMLSSDPAERGEHITNALIPQIEKRLGTELVLMPGSAHFRASGFHYYWLMTNQQLRDFRNAVGDREVSEIRWGFAFS